MAKFDLYANKKTKYNCQKYPERSTYIVLSISIQRKYIISIISITIVRLVIFTNVKMSKCQTSKAIL